MITLIIAAIILGLSNGLSPGPTLALVISHTIQHNLKAGIKIACGPILFGLTVVPISIVISAKLDSFKIIMGVVSIVGAMYIAYLGFKECFVNRTKLIIKNIKPRSFSVGVLANFSSPYAYVFWFTVGAPLIIRTSQHSVIPAIIFVSTYYACLIGSKIVVALIVENSRSFIEQWYAILTRVLGVILLIFAVLIFKDGIAFFS